MGATTHVMTSSRPAVPRRAWRWAVAHGRATFDSIDFKIGLVAGTGSAAAVVASAVVRDSTAGVLLFEAGLGAGITGVVLGAIAIVVNFDPYYLQILQLAPDGVRGALRPFLTVAVVGGAATVWSAMSALVAPALNTGAQAVAVGVGGLFTVWAVAGTVQLVELVVFHGEKRAELLQEIADARRRVERSRSA